MAAGDTIGRYAVSSNGWFQAAVGAACWRSFPLPFTAAQFVSYPYPGQHLSILSRTHAQIVIQAITPKFGYRELDNVDARTDFEEREVVYTQTAHATYRVAYRIARATPIAAPALRCAGRRLRLPGSSSQ